MNLSLRAVGEDDEVQVRFLYELLKERPAAANISHTQMPTYEQHCAFVKRGPYACWHIVMMDDVMAGSVYLTRNHEIGVHIHSSHRRLGLAHWAIKALMWQNGEQRYLANVAPGNAASHALFKKLSGTVIQHTYAVPMPVHGPC